MTFKEYLIKWNKGIETGVQTKFAKAIGVVQVSVSRWVKGDTPDELLRPRIAKELGITVEQLMACFPPRRDRHFPFSHPDPRLEFHVVSYVPVLATVSAENFNLVQDGLPEEFLPVPYTKNQRLIAVRIKGQCMEPTVRDGEYAVIHLQDTANNGDLIVAKVNGECTFKRLIKKTNHIELKPDNPKYKTICLQEVKIIGVVKYFIRKP